MIVFHAMVIGLSFFIQALMGFGGGLICIPLLSLSMPVQKAVTLVLIFQTLMGFLVFKVYKQIEWELIKKLGLSIFVGLMIGFMGLHFLSERLIAALLILMILMHLMRSRLKIDAFKRVISVGGGKAAGFLGGVQQALLGTGGAPLVIYLKEVSVDSGHFRANVMMLLFLMNLPRVMGSAVSGMLDSEILWISMCTLPVFLVALWLGQTYHSRIEDKSFNLGVDVLLGFSCVLLIGKYLWF